MKNLTVKARSRHGTSSLDLTLPTKIKNKEKINEGDLFKVISRINDDKEVEIVYTLIYRNK